jgi:hypothetical protein
MATLINYLIALDTERRVKTVTTEMSQLLVKYIELRSPKTDFNTLATTVAPKKVYPLEWAMNQGYEDVFDALLKIAVPAVKNFLLEQNITKHGEKQFVGYLQKLIKSGAKIEDKWFNDRLQAAKDNPVRTKELELAREWYNKAKA